MDNFIAELFLKRKLILRNTKTLDFKAFSKKRNYELIYGIDEHDYHTFVFLRSAKSKMLSAELEFLDVLSDEIAAKLGIIVNKRILFYSSAICSKLIKPTQNSKNIWNSKTWKFYDFM